MNHYACPLTEIQNRQVRHALLLSRCPASRFHLSRTPVSRLWIPHHDQRHRPRSPLSRLADAPKSVTRRPVDSPSFRGRRSRYRAAGNSATPSRQVAEFVVRRAIELPSLPCAEAPMSLVADLPSRRAFKSPRLSLAEVVSRRCCRVVSCRVVEASFTDVRYRRSSC
jgi:hypothetical protein